MDEFRDALRKLRVVPRALMKATRGALEDHPHLVNCALFLLVLGAVWVFNGEDGRTFELLRGDGLDLSLGMLTVAGIMAGFVGVVVVFGLQASAPVFVRFRVAAGQSLGRNWLVLIATGFLSTAAAMAAAVAYAVGALPLGFGALLLSVLLSVHAALRMLWLVRVLIEAVRLDDTEKLNPSKVEPAAKRYTPAP
ncbi:hypothetical protein GCM10009592_28280 [Brachybacterium rhamnosum]|uniref:Uncharacterized protein n=1 Tax=Brachybacterium rhamnosum TaxID=173361 RepID=A0ABW4PZW9_9MICO